MPDFAHIMVDIETLSTRANAVIVTIAGVKFNLGSDETENFCVNINPREGRKLGLHISPETLTWWREQKPEATQAWMHSQVGLTEALEQFSQFAGTSETMKYWCNGTNFDYPIMDSSYTAVGMTPPWKWWNMCDARTAFFLGGLNTFKEKRVGQYHNAIDDCLTQIAWLKKAIGATNDN